MNEHNVPLQYLEAYDSNSEDQKLEYSLHQHLANNMIDLYINLPSKNKFRRPASYMSQGYRTRRMAVDYGIPLITNIKCAKLFVEALTRGESYEISSHDYQTSHRSTIIPGLVNITNEFENFSEYSKLAVAGGFTALV